MRCFIAIDLSDSMKESMSACIRQLKPVSSDVRWVAPVNLHLTLKFLGEVPEARMPELLAVLPQVALASDPFELSITGTGAFPNERRPNVLWAGVRAPDALRTLYLRVEDAMAGLGFPKEQRRFSPHLTIGRVKGHQGMPDLMGRFRTFQNTFFGSIDVHEIVLMQSILKPTGAEYAKVGAFRLRRDGNQGSAG